MTSDTMDGSGQGTDPFTREERRTIETAVGSGSDVHCPRCGSVLRSRSVDPGPAVAYVRHRLIFVCPGCRLAATIDVPP